MAMSWRLERCASVWPWAFCLSSWRSLEVPTLGPPARRHALPLALSSRAAAASHRRPLPTARPPAAFGLEVEFEQGQLGEYREPASAFAAEGARL